MDKNLPANARDTGLIPGPERPHAVEQVSLSATTTELTHSRAGAPQGRVAWLTASRESNEDGAQPKINKKFFKEKIPAPLCS